MADTAVAEEIRKRRTADRLLANDDDDELDQEDQVDQGDQGDQGAQDDQGDQLAAEEEIDKGAEPSTPEEKAPDLGYRFVPVTAPDQDVSQNVPQGTFQGMGEQGLDVSPALTTQKIYSPPPEEGDQPYVIDQDTGRKIPRAQLATPEDLAAQPPTKGAVQLPQEVVTGQAPDQLTQVERAELVKPPAEAPGQLPQVERGELVKVPPGTAPRAVAVRTAAAVKPAEPAAPSTRFMGEEGLDVTPTAPAVKRAEPVAPPTAEAAPISVPTAEYTERVQKWQAAMRAYGFDAKVKPDGTWVGVDSQGKEVTPEQNKGLYQFGARLSQQYGFSGQEQKLGQLGDAAPTAPTVKRAEAIPAPPKVQPTEAAPVTEESAITNQARDGSYRPYQGQRKIAAIILHSSDGHEKGDINTLTGGDPNHQVSAHYYTTADGRSLHFVNDNDIAFHAGATSGKHGDLNNSNTIGIEQEHIDGQPWSEDEVKGTAQTVAEILRRHPELSLDDVLGHSDIAPERKQDPLNFPWDRFRKYVQADLGGKSTGQAPEQAAAVPQAQPVTKQANGLYQSEKSGDFLTGKATTFATPEDLASGADNGRGSKNLGGLDTTIAAGVAIPEAALRAKYGNNYAAWRRARVDLVDPQTGKRLRVPIVDVGPRGDLSAIVDMTPTISNYFGGDKTLMVKLVDDAGPDVNKKPLLFADEQSAIKQGFDSSAVQPGVQKIVPPQGYVFKPVDSARNTALQQGFEEASKAAIAQLPEQNKSLPALINRLDQPIKGVPDEMRRNYQQAVKDEATKYAQDYYGIKDPKEAYAKIMSSPDIGTFFGEIKDKILPYLNQAVTSFNQSAVTIDQNRLDMLAKAIHPDASPEERKTFISSITSEPDDVKRKIMINTMIGNLAHENPNNPALAALNAGDIADSAGRMADPEYQKRQQAEIARQVEANTKALRPDPRLQGTTAGWWAEQIAQLPKNIVESRTGLLGVIGQSLMLSEIYQGTIERLRKDNPNASEDEIRAKATGSTIAQIIPAEILNRLTGGKLAGLTSAIENPVQRIGLSALAHVGIAGPITGAAQQVGINIAEGKPITEGVLQAAGAGAIQVAPGVVHAVVHGRAPVAEERPPVTERPSVIEPVPPSVEPVRRADVLGPDVPDISMPWYKPGPIVTRAAERTGFSPQELARKVEELRQAGWSPSQIQHAMENLSPEPDFSRQTVHLGAEAQADLGPQPTMVTQEDVARRTYELGQERAKVGQLGTPANDYAQAQKELSQTTEPILPGAMSEAEPVNSAIANRYVQQRMATGELGQIDPSQGKSTEDMVNQGLKMSPMQRDSLIDNFTKGKGGNLDQQGAAIRSKEALLSEQARAASRDATADPTNPQLQAQAKAAADAVTAFHNGPIKKFKQVWSDAGRGLQREIPLDYTTLNGMKEAYLKGNNKEAPANLEPKLKQMADAVSKTTDAERVALNNFGKEIEKQTRGKNLPPDDSIRAKIMALMKDLPCET